jgi:hypothetical protein
MTTWRCHVNIVDRHKEGIEYTEKAAACVVYHVSGFNYLRNEDFLDELQ